MRLGVARISRRSLPALVAGALVASLGAVVPASSAVAAPASIDWTQTDWSGGAGQPVWADSTKYESGTSVDTSGGGQVRLSSTGGVVFADSFTRSDPSPLAPWQAANTGSWAIAAGELSGNGDGGYGNVYYVPPSQPSDYVLEARLKMPAGLGSLGGGIGGRLDPATGAHYGIWLYPTAGGGTNAGRIVLNEFSPDWTTYNELAFAPFSIDDANWHDVKVEFVGSRIRAWMDGGATPLIDFTDPSPLAGSGITFDTYRAPLFPLTSISVDSVSMSVPTVFSTSGALVSSAFDAGANSTWQTLKWTASTPSGTTVRLRTRTAATSAGLVGSAWSAWSAVSDSPIADGSGRWLQYEVDLGTSDSSATPVLNDVTATYIPADSVAPVVTVPADITVPATGAAGAVVTFTASAVDDVDGALTPTCTPVSGSTFPVGPTTVTCTATDTGGNPASKAFTITVTAPAATPAPPATATPVPPVSGQPSPVVRLKAVSGRSKLKVDVDPNKGGKYWTFQVQRKNADGSWKALKTYRTKGSKEIRTVNLGKGTYRVWVNPKFGYQGVLSATEVTLKR